MDSLEYSGVQVFVLGSEYLCGDECADVFDGAVIAVAFFAGCGESGEVAVRWWECCLQVHGL